MHDKIWARLDALVNADADVAINDVITSVGRLENGSIGSGAASNIMPAGKVMAMIQLEKVYEIEGVKSILQKADAEGAYAKDSYKSNISMKVTYFDKKNATTKTGSMTSGGDGYIAAKITILDLTGGGVSRDVARINLTKVTPSDQVVGNNIKQLTNIVEAYNAVKAKFESSGFTPKDIVEKCAGDPDRIKTEKRKEEVMKVVETAAKTELDKVYGYKATANVTACTIATSGETGKVSFTVTVASLSDATAKVDIEMTDAEYAEKDSNNMTFAEFEEEWKKLSTAIEGAALPETKDAALEAIKTKAADIVKGDQTGDLKATLAFEAQSAAEGSKKGGDGTDKESLTGLTGVTIVIKRGGDTIYTTTTSKDFTFSETP